MIAIPPMHRPLRRLIRMAVTVSVIGGIAGALYVPLRDAFLANPAVNGIIIAVFLLGIVYQFRRVVVLYPEIRWVEAWRHKSLASQPKPKLLAPVAAVLGSPGKDLNLSALSVRSLLDGIAARLEESRDISRYMIGLLIFLGLLGTFWGLLQTLGSVGKVIDTLGVSAGDPTLALEHFRRGLSLPLAGMSTAFSSSLFGLSGSLVLGFLDLQVGQAQNRFFNDLEEWFASVTKLSRGAVSDDDALVPAYLEALLGQTNENLEKLIGELRFADKQRGDAQHSLEEVLRRVGDGVEQGHKNLGAEIRNEIRLLARTLAKIGGSDSPGSKG